MGERDWIKVVERERCGECGLRASAVPRDELGAEAARYAYRWDELLDAAAETAAGDRALRARPEPATWSALECAGHVRDLLAVMCGRVVLMLVADEPTLGWWDHEAAVDQRRYNQQPPPAMADQLVSNALRFQDFLGILTSDARWERAGFRRPGERFTIDSLARFTVHEVRHHHVDALRAMDWPEELEE